MSDLGEGFAQEVNASILLQHLQQAEAAAEEGRQGSSTLETLQVPPLQPSLHGSIQGVSSGSPLPSLVEALEFIRFCSLQCMMA